MSSPTEYKGKATPIWNHQGPVRISPLFDWPPGPMRIVSALLKRWVSPTRNVLFLAIALVVFYGLNPPLAEMENLSVGWVGQIFFRNFVLLFTVAGGLHWYLHVRRGQGMEYKFDHRTQFDKSKKFLFNDQVKDNIFMSLTGGVATWSIYEVLYYWGVANGAVQVLEFDTQWWAFLVWFLTMPFILSTHFYFIHRFLHWPSVFHRFHRQHHNNIQTGPWSGMSMHPVEQVLYVSSVLIHFVIVSHPVVVMYHLYMRCLAPAFSHSGYEKLVFAGRVITDSADFHHQLHHKYFECNYGNVDGPWDRVLDTLHDGSEADTLKISERRRKMYADRRAA